MPATLTKTGRVSAYGFACGYREVTELAPRVTLYLSHTGAEYQAETVDTTNIRHDGSTRVRYTMHYAGTSLADARRAYDHARRSYPRTYVTTPDERIAP